MEYFGAFLEEDWESLSKLFSVEDSQNFLPHTNYHAQCLSFPSETLGTNSSHSTSQKYSSEETGNAFFTNQDNVMNNEFDSLDFHMIDGLNGYSASMMPVFDDDIMKGINGYSVSTMPVFADDMMEEIGKLNADLCNDQLCVPQIHQPENNDQMQLKRKYKAPRVRTLDKSDDKSLSGGPKKKSRISKDNKNKRKNSPSRKNRKVVQISNDAEEKNKICSSENDSKGSQELNEGTSSERKAKTNRGSAMDPQSLYARKRRERINERLKILQNLVPNGTKVDISTMLEEAVQYVKFLQVQIKLLSSDDLWMYAPIAYNGMDMGFYQQTMIPNLHQLGLDSV